MIKRLEGARCPWCGNLYDVPGSTPLTIDAQADYCLRCNHWGKSNFLRNESLLLLVFSMTGACLFHKVFPPLVILFLVVYAIKQSEAPKFRELKGKGLREPPAEIELGRADILWYSLKEDGIGFPKLRIWSNMIFPICVFDESGVLISHTGCVRLQKHYGVLWKKAKVLAITDTISEEVFQKGKSFHIYNKSVCIGEGKIHDINIKKGK